MNNFVGEDILLEDDIPVKDPSCSILQNEPTPLFIEVATQTLGCVGKSGDDEEYDDERESHNVYELEFLNRLNDDDKVDTESVINNDIEQDEQQASTLSCCTQWPVRPVDFSKLLAPQKSYWPEFFD